MKQIEFKTNIYDIIRRNIKKYRKERGMTSAQLAELVDLSHDFIRQIESEKTAYNFSVDTFYKISVALGVKLDDLIQDREKRIAFGMESKEILMSNYGTEVFRTKYLQLLDECL